MPDKETIIGKVEALPFKPLTEITGNPKYFWEGNENGASFKVTKEIFPPPMQLTIVSLSVSGEASGKQKVISEFKEVFGEELESETLLFSEPVEFVLFDYSAVKQFKT